MADERARAMARLRGSEAAKSAVRDEAKSRLEKLAKVVGNDEIAKRIERGNATRDQMLAFVTERLQLVRELQERELALVPRGANWEWWRQAADSHREGVHEPEPKQWHAVASAYEEAVHAMCRGDLRRAQDLLQKATEIERQTTDDLTKLADTREVERAAEVDPGFFSALVAETPSSGACAEPTSIRSLLHAILSVDQTVPEMPNRRRRRDPWWTLEEDEEEDKPDGEGG